MTPSEAKLRIPAEWRMWVGHQEAPAPHSGHDVKAFFEHVRKNYPDLLLFESSEDKQTAINRWLTDAGLIKG